jgi:glutamate synthase domain-containing protein 3
MAEVNAERSSIREVNAAVRKLIAEACTDITVLNPGARHNLAVAILDKVRIRITGSAGYYCGGLGDGASIEIEGSAGWGLAESMLSGKVVVHGNAGSGAAAALRSGTVVVHGDAAARLGVSMKGGEVIVAGSCGYMAGFMAQKGTLIVCGDTGEAFADSMYAVVSPMDAGDIERLEVALSAHLPAALRRAKPAAADFKKVVAGGKLWNFDKREWRIWQEAL